MTSFSIATLSLALNFLCALGFLWKNKLCPLSRGKELPYHRIRSKLSINAQEKPAFEDEVEDLFIPHFSDGRILEIKSEDELSTLDCLRSQSSIIPSFFDFDADVTGKADNPHDDSVYTPFVATLCPSTAWFPTPGFHFTFGSNIPEILALDEQRVENFDRSSFEIEDLSCESDDDENVLAVDPDHSHSAETNADRINQVLFQRAHTNFVDFMSRFDYPVSPDKKERTELESTQARPFFSSQASLSMQCLLVDISGILSARASGHISRVERKDDSLEVSMTSLNEEDVSAYLRVTGQTYHRQDGLKEAKDDRRKAMELTKMWSLPILADASTVPADHTSIHAFQEDEISRVINDWAQLTFPEKIQFSIHLGVAVSSPPKKLQELAAHPFTVMFSVARAALAVQSYRQSLIGPSNLSHFQFRKFNG